MVAHAKITTTIPLDSPHLSPLLIGKTTTGHRFHRPSAIKKHSWSESQTQVQRSAWLARVDRTMVVSFCFSGQHYLRNEREKKGAGPKVRTYTIPSYRLCYHLLEDNSACLLFHISTSMWAHRGLVPSVPHILLVLDGYGTIPYQPY